MAPETTRLCDEISIMKYICKEFWNAVFNKQIDNLRTNNSVTKTFISFLLQECNFNSLISMA
jgi:hypothetical protein